MNHKNTLWTIQLTSSTNSFCISSVGLVHPRDVKLIFLLMHRTERQRPESSGLPYFANLESSLLILFKNWLCIGRFYFIKSGQFQV